MKKITLFLTLFYLAFGAKLPDIYSADDAIRITGFYISENNNSCVVLYIRGSAIGTQNDEKGFDLIDFSVYDDGELKKKEFTKVKKGKKGFFSLLIHYQSKNGDKVPGVAIESKELNIYIDPFHLKKVKGSCENIEILESVEREVETICDTISRLGGSCY